MSSYYGTRESHLRRLQMQKCIFIENQNMHWKNKVKPQFSMKTSKQQDHCSVILHLLVWPEGPSTFPPKHTDPEQMMLYSCTNWALIGH